MMDWGGALLEKIISRHYYCCIWLYMVHTFWLKVASAIAKRFNIPTLVIGSTIVAFGTSMLEFTVNINAALNGNTDLALGNILGRNLFNLCATAKPAQ